MEFFERAHTKRNTEKKDTKSDIIMKKQLKQMLHGYKENDNKLIKTCVRCKSEVCDPQHCFDDSSSVSGFSDLNLTSSCEDADKNDITLNYHLKTDLCKSTKASTSSFNDNYNEDLEEFSDNVKSLGDSQDETNDMASNEIIDTDESCTLDNSLHLNQNSMTDSSPVSFLSNLSQDSSSSNESELEEFDPDGALASRILEKLNKKVHVLEAKQGRKRKVGGFKENTIFIELVPDSVHHKSKVYKHKRKSSESNEDYEFDIYYNDKNYVTSAVNEETIDRSAEEQSSQDSSSTHSSPYISITAISTPSESLSEILGEYKHPTVRNLPCEKQNIVPTNSGLFSAEDISMIDAEIEEEVSSLIPELNDDLSIEDLELSTDNITTEPNEESTSVYDDTIISESAERESSPNNSTDDSELVNPVKVYTNKKICILVISHPGRIYVHGKVKVKALGGVVEVFGYTLKDEWCELYAPNYSYAQCIKTIEIENAYHGLFSKLTAIGLSVSKAEEIVTNIGEYDGVIAMCPLDSRKMDFVDNNFTVTDIFGKQSKDIDSSLKKGSDLLGCSLYLSSPTRVLETHQIWENVINCGLGKLIRKYLSMFVINCKKSQNSCCF